jgi:hypothetical protein
MSNQLTKKSCLLFFFAIFEDTFMMKFNEPNDERKKTLQNFFDHLSRFTSHHVDPMEFMLLKSIILFKSGTIDCQKTTEKALFSNETSKS